MNNFNNQLQRVKLRGFSIKSLKLPNHFAAIAPSTTLWSLLKQTFIMLAHFPACLQLSLGTHSFLVLLTARIIAYGGFTIAVK